MPNPVGTYPVPDYSGNQRTQRYAVYTPSQLTGNIALVFDNPASGQLGVRGRVLALDPGAAARAVKLPATSGNDGTVITIRHVGSTNVPLIIQSALGAYTGFVIYKGEELELWCVGGVWRGPDAGTTVKTNTIEYFTDFLGIPGGSMPEGLATQDTSAAGAPTLDYVAEAHGGVFRLQLATNNEVEAISVYGGDQRSWSAASGFYMEMRVRFQPDVTGATATPAAGDKIVMGMASDRNATLDNIAANAWFMIGGAADMNLRVEADDGTIDVDDISVATTVAANTWMVLGIDMMRPGIGPTFYVNGVLVAQLSTVVLLNGMMQPFIEVAKAAALNEDHRLDIDYLYIKAVR